MPRFLIIYAAMCLSFFLGWLIAALCAAGKIRRLEVEVRALHLLRDDESRAWLATLVRAVAHREYKSQDGGAS